jgi:hypothetical protein
MKFITICDAALLSLHALQLENGTSFSMLTSCFSVSAVADF